MSKKSKTRHSLSRRITALIAILKAVMFLAVSFISYRALRSTYLRLYGEKAQDIVRFLASEIDGDRLYHYVETGETDSYYDWLSQEFTRFKSQFSGIAFLYLFYPEEEQFIYILEAIRPGDDPEKISSMGDCFEYGEMELAHLVPDIKAANLSAVIREYALRIIGVQLLFMLLVLLLVIEILRRNVTQPVGQLSKMVESYEHGSVTQPKFRHKDELQMLGNSFAEMTERINAYTQEVARATEEQGRISAEYNVAKQIQTDILPSVFPAFPERRDFDIYASLYSSKEICGDFYDFFLIDEDHLCMVVGDVSGKGVPAAMFMVIVKTLIKNRALQGFSPAEVLQNVSEQVLEGNNAGMFTTVWLAVLELSTGKGLAANAGQEHPALRHAGKRFELQEYRHSPPVGAMEGVRFRDHGFQLEPGDTLFVYTDGVKDSKNPKEEPFGKERILEALNREPEATPSVLLQTMKSAIDSFYGEAQQADDLTMLSLKYYGTGQPSDEWK